MEKDFKKLLKEEKVKYDLLKNEPHFEVGSFTEELLPLLGDYFLGNFALRGDDIICTFENGQIIKLTAREITAAD